MPTDPLVSEARVQAIQALLKDWKEEIARYHHDYWTIPMQLGARLADAITAHHEALDTLRQELEREREKHDEEAYNDILAAKEAAEAECATLRAHLAVVSSEPQTP